MTRCRFCYQFIHPIRENNNEFWVDDTDGDCCSGSDELENENGVHVPMGMLEQYSDYSTKFSSPLACFVWDVYLMNGDNGDEDCSDGNGFWANRYGKRILVGDDQGFVALYRYESENNAKEAFAQHSEYCYQECECEDYQ